MRNDTQQPDDPTQLPMFPLGRTRPVRYAETSREAWARFRKGNGELSVNGKIVRYLSERGPSTCEGIRAGIHAKHQTVSAQIRHLRDMSPPPIVSAGTMVEDGRAVNLYGVSE